MNLTTTISEGEKYAHMIQHLLELCKLKIDPQIPGINDAN